LSRLSAVIGPLHDSPSVLIRGTIMLNVSHLTLLDNVTSYSTKLRNPTQVATMTTALDLGVI
jgi:hypothetical protein